MRLGRIASPDGVAFVEHRGSTPTADAVVPGDRRASVRHAGRSPAGPGRWPTCGCSRRSWPARWCAWARTTPRTPPRWAATAPEDPVIFLKPNTAIIGPNIADPAARRRPPRAPRRRAGGGDRPARARTCPQPGRAENILGYTIANDVSARDQQKKDGQWMRAKGHDTFCPVGPWIDTDLDPVRPGAAHRGQRANCASTAGRR